jgi:CRP/FNR family transcriptional regulator
MLTTEELDFMRERLDFYGRLAPAERAALEGAATVARFAKGASLKSRDGDCLGVLVLRSGSLRAFIQGEDGREVTLYRIAPGEECVLSASCVLNSLNFDVFIEADADSEAIKINIGVFERLMAENVWVENFAYKSAVNRFGDVMWAVEQVLFMRFDRRLAIFLLDESAKTGSVQATHDQIAKYVGSAREVVSRMLKQFETKGLVRLSRGSIDILDREALKRLA